MEVPSYNNEITLLIQVVCELINKNRMYFNRCFYKMFSFNVIKFKILKRF